MDFFIKTKLLQTKIEMLETEYHIDVLNHLRMAKTVKYNCLLSACCFKNDDEFNVELLKKISEIFGLTDEEFLGADGNKAFKYRNKYSEFGVIVLMLTKNHSWVKALVASIIFSSSIELSQLIIGCLINNMYRTVDIDDIILNVIGVYIGYGIFYLLPYRIKTYCRTKSRNP